MTTSFYTPPDLVEGSRLRLPPDEAHHATRVIRHREGDVIRVVDGCGMAYLVRLTVADVENVQGDIERAVAEEHEPPYRLTLAVGVLKQRARFETMVEKAVELGVHTLIPIVSSRTEKSGVRIDRLEKIALAGLKQSGRSRLTRVTKPIEFNSYLRDADSRCRLICHEQAAHAPFITDRLKECTQASIDILIGPEGGFDEMEISRAEDAGFVVVHLGARRLRAETAAMFAASACAMMLSRI